MLHTCSAKLQLMLTSLAFRTSFTVQHQLHNRNNSCWMFKTGTTLKATLKSPQCGPIFFGVYRAKDTPGIWKLTAAGSFTSQKPKTELSRTIAVLVYGQCHSGGLKVGFDHLRIFSVGHNLETHGRASSPLSQLLLKKKGGGRASVKSNRDEPPLFFILCGNIGWPYMT